MDDIVTSRRGFLKGAGALGLAALTAYAGGKALYADNGSYPIEASPYAASGIMERWPLTAREASPILILVNDRSDNPFGTYYGEILAAEGLNAFQMGRLPAIAEAPLEWYDTILLSEGPVRNDEAERLAHFVAQGGNLIAMRPDGAVAALCGLQSAGGEIANGYIQVKGPHPVTGGITPELMQFHGTARRYRLAAGSEVCSITSARDERQGYPGVVVSQAGKGNTGAWAFDLARSIVLMRQGNPALADVPSPDWDGIRPVNLFVNWIDLECAKQPQADEQQRLLANMLWHVSQERRPLPRLWYFPGSAASMLIVTGDCHGNKAESIEEYLTLVEQRGGHASIYYTPQPGSDLRRAVKRTILHSTGLPLVGPSLGGSVAAPAPSDVAAWRSRGHEFGLHPYVDGYSVEPGLVPGWRRYWKEFTGLGYSPVPPTTRTHRIQWSGWSETARVQASYGMQMNLDYYQWGPLFRNKGGEWTYGHLTGSGLPMRFVDEQGKLLTIYQQLTHIADDHLLNGDWGGHVLLDGKSAVGVSEHFLSASLKGAYAAITGNFHVDPLELGAASQWADEFRTWMGGTLDYAAEHDIPIWSAEEWLSFTQGRHDATLEDLDWDAESKTLRFEATTSGRAYGDLSLLIPLSHAGAGLAEVEVDGHPVAYEEQTVGAVVYAAVAVTSGSTSWLAAYA